MEVMRNELRVKDVVLHTVLPIRKRANKMNCTTAQPLSSNLTVCCTPSTICIPLFKRSNLLAILKTKMKI